ncbi:adhesion G protein-coupled receptor G3 isoform X2 [Syngnathus scovelli]|uniref:adhesion G protein-coupled receptor G3 isoform X2 n=1 Tax=Syngnathus scovelli TaxID=161590 RepID=UPI00211010F1|nr:adhesion G protein-coupled receptor G3 isoform X2 [Syngnathus scovelli]
MLLGERFPRILHKTASHQETLLLDWGPVMQVLVLLFWLSLSYADEDCLESNDVVTNIRPAAICTKGNDKPPESKDCEDVLSECLAQSSWIRCYKQWIVTCKSRGRSSSSFISRTVDPSEEKKKRLLNEYQRKEHPTPEHGVHIPSSALQRSRAPESKDLVVVVVTVLDSAYFKPPKKHGRRFLPGPPGTVLGGTVLVVQAGLNPLQNLSEPITMTFKHNMKVANGTCVFWEEINEEDGTGHWSTFGCITINTGNEFICRCNHLSFFAVLVNPDLSLSEEDAFNLSLITYVGSALSVIFTIISLIIYSCLNKQQPERAIGLHMHLTAALLCLHLCFLLCCLWAWRLGEQQTDWFCGALGFLLHWSLLAAVCWSALEGFHLYLLLVRVFNIYIRRYLLRLSVVGWGMPTLIALICGVSGVYGKYTLKLRDSDNSNNSTIQLCWMNNKFIHTQAVIYATTMVFPCLVVVFNSCMLGLVVFKLWRLRAGGAPNGAREKTSRLWKDCVTVLGLSCVLGLPFGLSSATYVSLPGIYIFTVLNSVHGVFMFLWSLALTYKSRSDAASSSKYTSSQRIMTTSFNS